jgi:hypothetical protein
MRAAGECWSALPHPRNGAIPLQVAGLKHQELKSYEQLREREGHHNELLRSCHGDAEPRGLGTGVPLRNTG